MPVPTVRRSSVTSSYTPHYSYYSSSLDRTTNLPKYSSYTSTTDYSYRNLYLSNKPPIPSSRSTSSGRESRSSNIKYSYTDYSKSVPLVSSGRWSSKCSVNDHSASDDEKDRAIEIILNRYNRNNSYTSSSKSSPSYSRSTYSSNSYNGYSNVEKDTETTRRRNYQTQNSLSTLQKRSESSNSLDSGYNTESSASRPWRRHLSLTQDNCNSVSNRFNSISKSSDNENGASGLQNLGNTCFMNSILQCLAHTRPLLDYCLRDNYSFDINTTQSSMKGTLIKEFSNLLQMMWKKTASAVDPHNFKSQVQRFAPRFTGYNQQDAQEFLRYVLQGLHDDVNRVTIRNRISSLDLDDHLSESQKATESWRKYLKIDDSKIVDIFVGQLKSTLKCCSCGNTSVTFDPFWDLSLPIPKSYSSVKLTECLDLFTNEEVLIGDEMPVCSKCKAKRKSTKRFSIQKFPQILVIRFCGAAATKAIVRQVKLDLKRFTPGESYRTKLSTKVEFPLSLDLHSYSTNTCSDRWTTYNLYAVSNHSGSTSSGHYTAYCKHPYTEQWLEYNDSRVSRNTKTGDIVTSEAYILFYEMSGRSARL